MIRKLTLIAALLTFFVILLGSYTRLTDAGLGCPDWPGCYGQLTAPHMPGQPGQETKAWTEMIHRYFAGSLSLLITAILIGSIANYRKNLTSFKIPLLLLFTVLFQAALGMWTVTLKLLPMVVMGHLLGGLTTLGLLVWLFLRLNPARFPILKQRPSWLLAAANFALLCLILQIALGGWTSSNYAALVCPDFPYCQGQWLPPLSWHAFQLNAGWGLENPLLAFGNIERVTIHMAHRIGAIITSLAILLLIIRIFSTQTSPQIRRIALGLLGLLFIQVLLGITNIIDLLPLPVAVAHSGVGALLLVGMIALQFYCRTGDR